MQVSRIRTIRQHSCRNDGKGGEGKPYGRWALGKLLYKASMAEEGGFGFGHSSSAHDVYPLRPSLCSGSDGLSAVRGLVWLKKLLGALLSDGE